MKESVKKEYLEKLKTPAEAVGLVESGDVIYAGCSSSVAYGLLEALGERMYEVEDVQIVTSNVMKKLRVFSGENPKAFYACTPFMGPGERDMQAFGLADYTSVHLSQVDQFYLDTITANVVFLEVSLPDEDGYFSFGAHGVAMNKYVMEKAEKVILQVNKNVPYVYGDDTKVHISQVTALAEMDTDIMVYPNKESGETLNAISNFILEQIPDGACIQMGLGGVTNAICEGLKVRNDLGVHTELFNDAMMELTEMGVINNSQKAFMPGKSVASFAFGTKKLYEYLNHNTDVYFMPFPVTNNPVNIAKNDNMISVNTALAIDLLGQVCADNIGGVQYSSTGGQLDFVRGAQMSKGGKSFIAITSTYNDKKKQKASRIVAQLPLGSVVTTPRSDVQYVATEYGCVNLKTLTMHNRVRAMIDLADPDFRPQLLEDAKRLKLI